MNFKKLSHLLIALGSLMMAAGFFMALAAIWTESLKWANTAMLFGFPGIMIVFVGCIAMSEGH